MKFSISLIIFFIFITFNTSNSEALIYEKEPNNSASTADGINFGDKLVGQLYSESDEDWYQIQSTGNNAIVIQFYFMNAPLAELYKSWEISIRDSVYTPTITKGPNRSR